MSPEMDLETERIPVFCTAVLPIEVLIYTILLLEFVSDQTRRQVLQDFTASTQEAHEGDESPSLPTIITSTSFEEALMPRPQPSETWIKPFIETGSPFLGWTPKELRDFFVSNCKPVYDFDAWPLATFGILDSLSVLNSSAPTHRTLVLCSFMPDFKEGSEVWLKTCRVRFDMFGSEVLRLETFVTRPSEIGKGTCLSFMPPLMLVGRDGTRAQVSTGIDNEAPYSIEHLAMQETSEGCLRYFVRPAPPETNGQESEAQA